jgi:hypothetical protein
VSRGILYIVWGSDHRDILARSIASIQHWHPELPYKVVEMPDYSSVLCKSKMCDLSPFDETLFLDADTTALGKLDYGFEKAKQHGIALCISACPWNRRYHLLPGQHHDEVEYSSGVIFFTKALSVQFVFERWKAISTTDSRCRYINEGIVGEQHHNDQAHLTLAMQLRNFNPFVLPLNWNLFPKWQKQFFGPVKIWHGYDDIPEQMLRWNKQQDAPNAVLQCASL